MLKAQFQELVLGDGGLTSFIKLLLEIGTNILKLANTDVGKLIITLTAIITTTSLLNKGLKAISTSFLEAGTKAMLMAQGMSAQTAAIWASQFATTSYMASLKALTVAWASSPFGMATIAIGSIAAIVGIIDALSLTTEELQNKISDLNSSISESENEIKSINDKIIEVNNSINDLNVNDEGLNQLQKTKQELESLLIIEQSRYNLKQKELEQLAQQQLSQKDWSTINPYTETGEANILNPRQRLEEAIEYLRIYKQELSELPQLTQDSTKEEIENYEKTKESLEDKIKLVTEAGNEESSLIENSIKELDDQSEIYKENSELLSNWADALKDGNDIVQKSSGSSENLNDILEEEESLLEKDIKTLQDYKNQLDDLTSAYETGINAISEYNQQGYLSVDTYSQLMQLAPEYLAMMIDENGQLYNNANGVMQLYQARVYEMGVAAIRAQLDLAKTMSAEAGSYAALEQAAYNAADGVWALVDAEISAQISRMTNQADIDALNTRIKAIKNLTNTTAANAKQTVEATAITNKDTSAKNANASATNAQVQALKAHKKALEDEQDALEAEIDDYETVIDYVKDLLKEEQEAVEEEKDTQLKAIQDKIDALEEEQEAFEENIDSQIDALEKQKDETEEYWNAQIDAINNANDALEENMELQRLQEALANAKTQKVKVLKDGRFVYAEDEAAISKAEQELADYEMQLAVQRQIEELESLKEEALNSLDKQIEELENYRNETKKNYDQQLEDLQNHYDAVESEYDKRIGQYDQWLEQFEDMLEASSKRHAELLYNELVGEQDNWDDRIKALSNFVNNYEAKKNQLDNIKSEINSITNQISSLESSSRTSLNNLTNSLIRAQNINSEIKELANQSITKYRYYAIGKNGEIIHVTGRFNDSTSAWKDMDKWIKENPDLSNSVKSYEAKVEKYAQGIYEVPNDQIALVADPKNPSSRELVVGSKINNYGVMTSLKKGTGVIPSGRNLTENLVNLAKWSQNKNFDKIFSTNNTENSNVINIENINLPQVQNGNDFINYLKDNFLTDSIQISTLRI